MGGGGLEKWRPKNKSVKDSKESAREEMREERAQERAEDRAESHEIARVLALEAKEESEACRAHELLMLKELAPKCNQQ